MEKKKISNYIGVFVGVAVVIWLFYGLIFSQFIPTQTNVENIPTENPNVETDIITE